MERRTRKIGKNMAMVNLIYGHTGGIYIHHGYVDPDDLYCDDCSDWDQVLATWEENDLEAAIEAMKGVIVDNFQLMEPRDAWDFVYNCPSHDDDGSEYLLVCKDYCQQAIRNGHNTIDCLSCYDDDTRAKINDEVINFVAEECVPYAEKKLEELGIKPLDENVLFERLCERPYEIRPERLEENAREHVSGMMGRNEHPDWPKKFETVIVAAIDKANPGYASYYYDEKGKMGWG